MGMRRVMTVLLACAVAAAALASAQAAGADDRILVDVGWRLSAGALGPAEGADWRADGMAAFALDTAFPAFRFSAARSRNPGGVAPILFDSNYLRVAADMGISPDILRFSGEITLEPIAFAHVKLGGDIGTGWDAGLSGFSGLADLHGLALNPADSAQPIRPIPFGGAVWSARASLPLNFGFHYLTLDHMTNFGIEVQPRVEYRALAGIAGMAPGQAWVWHSDGGMNLSGWKFNPDAFLGWKSPNVEGLRELGLYARAETWLGAVRDSSTIASGGWGSDAWTGRLGLRGGYSTDAWQRVDLDLWMVFDRAWTPATANLRYFGDRVYADTRSGFGGIVLRYTRLF